MATEEVNKPPSLPYSEMILAAIEALDDKNGSSKSAISEYIESSYDDLPQDHSTLLADYLNRMKESGELTMLKNNYMRPNPDAPLKRGRGRPPKAKLPIPPGTVVSPPRPRGRPPKPKDPSDLAAAPVKVSGPPRPRGRPPKKARPAVGMSTGSPRPRGRPPKAKAPFAVVGLD
ncbi:HMG-Y-related protein A-like [Magnolia sinica]|uniref:HMG-Y-related protein A-like n=1 Tax=Magnolia sinica TaxID=86752 RepID=UPI00265A65A5|nr:HMG-Y-related protein A-like [Magnolia sinica]